MRWNKPQAGALRAWPRVFLLSATALAAAVAVPAIAQAASLNAPPGSGDVTYDGGSEENQLVVTYDPGSDSYSFIDSKVAAIDLTPAGNPCTATGNEVTCPASAVRILVLGGGGVGATVDDSLAILSAKDDLVDAALYGGWGDDTLDASGIVSLEPDDPDPGPGRPIRYSLWIHGDYGDDTMIGASSGSGAPGSPENEMVGGAGSDTLIGGPMFDRLTGDGGDGTGGEYPGGPVESEHDDTIRGGGGGDDIPDSIGSDQMFGEGGSDDMRGTATDTIADDAPDLIDGGPGNDLITPGKGRDTVNGGSGDDYITTAFAPELQFTDDAAPDVYDGGDGNDKINPDQGPDTISGGAGDDKIFTGCRGCDGREALQDHDVASDTYYGGEGNDDIFPDGGPDTVFGGEGDDSFAFDTGGPLGSGSGLNYDDGFRDEFFCGPGIDRVLLYPTDILGEDCDYFPVPTNCPENAPGPCINTLVPSAPAPPPSIASSFAGVLTPLLPGSEAARSPTRRIRLAPARRIKLKPGASRVVKIRLQLRYVRRALRGRTEVGARVDTKRRTARKRLSHKRKKFRLKKTPG